VIEKLAFAKSQDEQRDYTHFTNFLCVARRFMVTRGEFTVGRTDWSFSVLRLFFWAGDVSISLGQYEVFYPSVKYGYI